MRSNFALFACLLATPASAATFHAQPVAPAASKLMAREIAWRCGTAGCVTNTDLSAPPIVCAGLVRKVGRLQSFSSNGVPFDESKLARCNARAR